MTTHFAEFENVSKTYRTSFRKRRDSPALRGVSFAVDPGEVFALLGPNRAGKTTLLKILLGLCRHESGKAKRFGRPISALGTLAQVGYMHENQAFPRYLNAREVLEHYGKFSNLTPKVLKDRVPSLLERVGLADRAREPISRFSKGMVQRLALAQSLVNDPDLLVLDEPMEGLDLAARKLLQEVIEERRATGKSVLLVSHAIEEVAEVADSVCVLKEGQVAYLGTLDALLHDPSSERSRTLSEALSPIYSL